MQAGQRAVAAMAKVVWSWNLKGSLFECALGMGCTSRLSSSTKMIGNIYDKCLIFENGLVNKLHTTWMLAEKWFGYPSVNYDLG